MKKLISVLSMFALIAGCSESANLTEQDKAAVLQIEDLAVWIEGFIPDPTKGSLVKTKEFDKSYDIDYTYEDQEGDTPLYLYHSVSVQPSSSDAMIVHKAMDFGTWIGSDETNLVTRNDLFSWGVESEFCLWQTESGDTFGNYFTGRKGKRVVMIAISGVYFDKPDALHELLDEKLEAVERLPVP
jgi:hypothetical protein